MSSKFEVLITENANGVSFDINVVDDAQATCTESYVVQYLINEVVKAAGELSKSEGENDAS